MINKLLKYQEVDSGLRKIEIELASSEDRKKALAAKKFLDGVEDAIVKLNNRSKELYEQYQIVLEEQKKFAQKEEEFSVALRDVENEDEVAYLSKKIDETIIKMKNLSSQLAKLGEEMQKVLAEYASLKAKTKSAKLQYEEFGKKYNELKASKKAERDAIESELISLEKDIDKALIERYKAKRAMKIFPIVYPVKEKNCGGCNMELSLTELSKLKGGAIVDCEQCGRLLYVPN